MELDGKVAVVYGGGGHIGGAVARAFAREGAAVYLAGRTQAPLDAVANDIRANGGRAETAIVDAFDETAVDAFVDEVVAQSGRLDISFNVVTIENRQGTMLVELTVAEVEAPAHQAITTQFITARAAARHMVPQGSGVILAFGGRYGINPLRDYQTGGHLHPMGGYPAALAAVNVLTNQLAMELGPHGVRVVGIETSGVPETMPAPVREFMEPGLANLAMLKSSETLADVADAAVFVCSDRARHITGTKINITGGNTAD